MKKLVAVFKKILLVVTIMAVAVEGYNVVNSVKADESTEDVDIVTVEDMSLTGTELIDSLDILERGNVTINSSLLEGGSGLVSTIDDVRQDGYEYLYLNSSRQNVKYIYLLEEDKTYTFDADTREGLIQEGNHAKLGYDAIGLSLYEYLEEYKNDITSASIVDYIEGEKVLYIEATRVMRTDHIWYSLEHGEILRFENYRNNDLVITMITNTITTDEVGESLFSIPEDVVFN
jgi:hypothetical protein